MGYFRIDLPEVPYVPLPCDSLPYSFHVAEGVRISSPARGQGVDLRYPAFGAELYCSYAYLKPGQLGQGLREGRALAERQAKNPLQMHEQIYTDSVHHVYASLFDLGGESASPYQFLITDSGRRLFQGALLYDCRPNADSLRPVNRHLQADIRHLIETFRWKN
jgi:gliding motility-associated lipoprotein GldD